MQKNVDVAHGNLSKNVVHSRMRVLADVTFVLWALYNFFFNLLSVDMILTLVDKWRFPADLMSRYISHQTSRHQQGMILLFKQLPLLECWGWWSYCLRVAAYKGEGCDDERCHDGDGEGSGVGEVYCDTDTLHSIFLFLASLAPFSFSSHAFCNEEHFGILLGTRRQETGKVKTVMSVWMGETAVQFTPISAQRLPFMMLGGCC